MSMSSKESVSIAGRFSSDYGLLGNSESFVCMVIFKAIWDMYVIIHLQIKYKLTKKSLDKG